LGIPLCVAVGMQDVRSALVVSWVVLVVLSTGELNARPQQRTPPPPPPPGMAPPPPLPPASSIARRPVELVPTLGLAFPSCASGAQSDDRCVGVEGGLTFGFSAFWRVTPHFAWGGGFDIAGFRYAPPDYVGLKDTQAGAAWIGLLGRLYLTGEGSLDPYLQLGLGGGALGTAGTEPGGDTFEETGAGPALQIGGGVDFVLSPRIKLGPALSYTHVFVDKIRRCPSGGGDCSDYSKDLSGHLNAFVSVSARLTIMIGDEL
jgi:opacity protein-like surface antigen